MLTVVSRAKTSIHLLIPSSWKFFVLLFFLTKILLQVLKLLLPLFFAKGVIYWTAKLAGVDLCEGTGSKIFNFAQHNVQVLQAHEVDLLCIM